MPRALRKVPKGHKWNIAVKHRTETLKKKLHELTTLCDIKACALIYDPSDPDQVDIWPKNRSQVLELIDIYRRDGAFKSYDADSFFEKVVPGDVDGDKKVITVDDDDDDGDDENRKGKEVVTSDGGDDDDDDKKRKGKQVVIVDDDDIEEEGRNAVQNWTLSPDCWKGLTKPELRKLDARLDAWMKELSSRVEALKIRRSDGVRVDQTSMNYGTMPSSPVTGLVTFSSPRPSEIHLQANQKLTVRRPLYTGPRPNGVPVPVIANLTRDQQGFSFPTPSDIAPSANAKLTVRRPVCTLPRPNDMHVPVNGSLVTKQPASSLPRPSNIPPANLHLTVGQQAHTVTNSNDMPASVNGSLRSDLQTIPFPRPKEIRLMGVNLSLTSEQQATSFPVVSSDMPVPDNPSAAVEEQHQQLTYDDDEYHPMSMLLMLMHAYKIDPQLNNPVHWPALVEAAMNGNPVHASLPRPPPPENEQAAAYKRSRTE